MRHKKSGKKLGRHATHRKAMLANLATSLFDKERIITTVDRAKETRGLAERLITWAKRGDLHSMRLAARVISNKDILKKLFSEIAKSYEKREGGYTRVIKLKQRKGDNATLAVFELVGRGGPDVVLQRKKKSKSAAGETPAEQIETTQEAASAETGESKVKEAKTEKKAEKTPKVKAAKKPSAEKKEKKAGGEEKPKKAKKAEDKKK
jgi:large subunit ribosomal protein L17